MSSPTSSKIFMSYCHADRGFCVPLIEKLRHTFDDEDLVFDPVDAPLDARKDSSDWEARIMMELARCAIYLVVLTPETLRSTMVKKTLQFVIRRRSSGNGPICIPVLRKACKLPTCLKGVAHISFESPGRSTEAYAELIRTLRQVIYTGSLTEPSPQDSIERLFDQEAPAQWEALLPPGVLAKLHLNAGMDMSRASSDFSRTVGRSDNVSMASQTPHPRSAGASGKREILDPSGAPHTVPHPNSMSSIGDTHADPSGPPVDRMENALDQPTQFCLLSCERPEDVHSRQGPHAGIVTAERDAVIAPREVQFAEYDIALPAPSGSHMRLTTSPSRPRASLSIPTGYGSVPSTDQQSHADRRQGTHRLVCPVDMPDNLQWRSEPGYSPSVAQALRSAYAYIRQSRRDVGDYLNAYRAVHPCLRRRMSSHQFINTCYVLAMSYAAVNDHAAALHYLDDALELAIGLNDLADISRLAYLHGVVNFAKFQLSECVDHLFTAREVLTTLSQRDDVSDPALELDILLYSSFSHFLLADFARAEQALRDGALLMPLISNQRLYVARGEWIFALLHSWRGQSDIALSRALAAAKLITSETHPPATYGRIGVLVTDIALNLAKALPTLGAQCELFNLAGVHIQQALTYSRSAGDVNGEGLALLAAARHARESGGEQNVFAMLEMANHIACRTGDSVLLSQVFTERGDAFAALGEIESMYHCYRESLTALERSEANAYKMRARRALLSASEMHVTDAWIQRNSEF